MRLLILDHATMDAPIVDFEAFAAANADDEALVAEVAALAPCQGITVGGGAAPAFSITRME